MRVLAGYMKNSWVLIYPLTTWQRLIRLGDTQAVPSLRSVQPNRWFYLANTDSNMFMITYLICKQQYLPINLLHSIKSVLCYEEEEPVSYERDGP